MKKPRLKTLIITFSVLVVLAILYVLADRYLIEHVEVASASVLLPTAAATLPAATNTEGGATASLDSDASITEPATDTADDSSTSVTTEVTSDDWNYNSSSVSISIEKVVTGSGSDTVTYFVADVTLADATQLASAFADDEFGRNIIDYTSQIAADNNAIFAINGDYYGFRTDGIIIRNGVIYRDEGARTGLAIYRDGTMQVYDETQTSAQELLDAGVWNTLSFGPALIDDGVVVNDTGYRVDNNLGNHPITGNQPRTAIGIISPNHYIFVVVDGRSKGYSRGVSLVELTDIFAGYGVTEAYNLDGGGSSTMVFMGRVVNNPLGRDKERGTSDILFIGE